MELVVYTASGDGNGKWFVSLLKMIEYPIVL